MSLLFQGVTLTDLQEAEKTIGRSRTPKTREEEKEEREKQDKEKQEEKKETETKEDDYRSKYLEVHFCNFSDSHPEEVSTLFLDPLSPLSSSVIGLYPPPPPFPLSALPPPRPTLAPHCPPVPPLSVGLTV